MSGVTQDIFDTKNFTQNLGREMAERIHKNINTTKSENKTRAGLTVC